MTAVNRTATLLFAGGGTGGHLYPAIAIADRVSELLRDHYDVDIHFVGTRRGIEYRLRDSLGYPLHIVNVRGLVRTFTLKNLLVPFVLISALIKSWRLLSRLKPDVVIGTGGYVALPVVRVAALRTVPTVLQEQNSFPGITTRKLAPHATHVFLGFGGAGSLISTKGQVTVSGNPVRQSLLGGDRNEAMRHFGLDPSKRTILIIGGSQGSRPINRAITRGLLDESLPESCQLLWQTGRLDHDQIVSELGDRAKGHTLFAFSNEMRLVYAAADIAIARAGALTIAELEACGVPAILVPYPFAAGDHQRKNADEYAGRGVAVVVDQKELDREDILRRAADALQDGTADRMRAALTQQQRSEPAVDVIANGIIDLIQREHSAGGIGDN